MATVLQHLLDIHPITGEFVRGWERGKASIVTILQTRFNTRLMREWFGSEYLNAMDKPINTETMVDSIIAAIEAINRFEPEFKVTAMALLRADSNGEGEVRLTLEDLVEKRNYRLQQPI